MTEQASRTKYPTVPIAVTADEALIQRSAKGIDVSYMSASADMTTMIIRAAPTAAPIAITYSANDPCFMDAIIRD